MKIGKKYGGWLVVLLAISALLFVVPAVLEKSWLEIVHGWFQQYSQAADEAQVDDDDATEVHTETHASRSVILSDTAMRSAGVSIVSIKATQYFPEIKAQARVINLQQMLALRSRYNQARAALSLAQATEKSAAAELARLKKLVAGAGSIATKKVSYAGATWREAHASLSGAQFRLEDMRTEAIDSWGSIITSWLLKPESKQFERLLTRADSLLLITLPVSESLPDEVSVIRVSQSGSRHQARKAYLVGPAYPSDQLIQGETYYFRTGTGRLRPGMRLEAWVPGKSEPLDGFFIPEQAIVWYAGQPWTYVEQDKGHFQRRSLASGLAAPNGMFMQQGFTVDEKLVTAGAQMLLSDEFRWQIQDEDDD